MTDHPSSVVELDTDGNVLRVIPSDGDHDFEAIEYLGRNRYVLSRERERMLTTHHIGRNTSVLPPTLYTLTRMWTEKATMPVLKALPVDGERMP